MSTHHLSGTSGFEKDTSNKKWITEEQFNDVFPRGYRECNFFSSPVEFWSMSKESFWDWEQTALLDLNSNINLQKNLQQTFVIGHSSDTKLLTELLNVDNKNSNIESLNKDTSIKIDLNETSKILRKKITNNKKCYTCNNICKCSSLLSNGVNHLRNYDTIPLLSKAQCVLPKIQLIDQINESSLKLLLQKNNFKLSEDISEAKIATPNTSKNCDIEQNDFDSELEYIFDDDNVTLPEEILNNIESKPTTPLDNLMVVTERTSRQIIQDESNDENDEYKENILNYFYLNSISDIFQDLQDDDDVYETDTGFNEMVYP